ncbi:MAG: hypothetical protein ACE5IW_08525, partial [bacterium]
MKRRRISFHENEFQVNYEILHPIDRVQNDIIGGSVVVVFRSCKEPWTIFIIPRYILDFFAKTYLIGNT